jgi:hypothetical protein
MYAVDVVKALMGLFHSIYTANIDFNSELEVRQKEQMSGRQALSPGDESSQYYHPIGKGVPGAVRL